MSKGFQMPICLMAEYMIAKYAFAVHYLPAYSPYLRDP